MGFDLIAGALAGLVIAFEMSLLGLVIWMAGSYTGMSLHEFAWWSLRCTAQVVLGLLTAGVIGGLVSNVLSRVAPAIHRLASQATLSLWVLGSFVYAVFGSVRVSRDVYSVATDALLAFVFAIAAYCVWRGLVRWLRRGLIRRVIVAVAAINAGWWISLGACFGLS